MSGMSRGITAGRQAARTQPASAVAVGKTRQEGTATLIRLRRATTKQRHNGEGHASKGVSRETYQPNQRVGHVAEVTNGAKNGSVCCAVATLCAAACNQIQRANAKAGRYKRRLASLGRTAGINAAQMHTSRSGVG